MDIQNLRYFIAVGQTLNITRAAEQLFISRQALSKAIHEFEREVGSELFTRENRKLQLTAFGRGLLEKSIPIMDLFNDFEESLGPSSWGKQNKIRIAIGLGTLNALSPQVFVNFKSKNPQVELSIKEVCDDEVRKNLDAQNADVGLLNSTPEKLADYEYRLVQEGKIHFQISKQNPLSKKDHLALKDLDRQPFVSLGDRCDMHSVVMGKCRAAGVSPNLILETIDSNVANDMVYNNIAVSLFIQSKNSVIHPAVRSIPLDLGDTPWGTYVILRKGADNTPSQRRLIEYLVSSGD